MLKLGRVLLFVFICTLALWGLAVKDFYTRGEARETLIIRSMFEDHKWILPEGYGGVVPSKPPVMHWLAAASSEILPNMLEVTARAPSLLLAVIAVFIFYGILTKRGIDSNRAFLASLILMSSPEWFRASVTARVDMTLAVFLCGATYVSFIALERRSLTLHGCAAFLLTGAFLTKGPVAIILWGVPIGLLMLLRRRETFFRDCTGPVLSCAFAVGLSSIWYFAAYLERPGAFFEKVYYENITRFLSNTDEEPHRKSALMLWMLFFIGLLPWSLVLIVKMRELWQSRAQFFSRIKSSSDFELLLLLQIVCTILFFSIPSGKRSVYLLPVYPAAAYFLSALISRDSQTIVRVARGAVIFLIGCLLFFSFAAAQFEGCSQTYCFRLSTYAHFIRESTVLVVFGVSIALSCLVLARFQKTALAHTSVLIGGILLTLHVSLFPLFANAVSPRQFVDHIKNTLRAEEQLFSYGNEFYSVALYLNRPISRLEDRIPSLYAVEENGMFGLDNPNRVLPEHGVVFYYPNDEEELREILSNIKRVECSEYGVVQDNRALCFARF